MFLTDTFFVSIYIEMRLNAKRTIRSFEGRKLIYNKIITVLYIQSFKRHLLQRALSVADPKKYYIYYKIGGGGVGLWCLHRPSTGYNSCKLSNIPLI